MARRNHGSARSDGNGDDDAGRGASRSLWSGTLGFGLVQIPVRLLSGESGGELAFHQLDRRNHARIRYERVNDDTGDKVDWKDIVKGYELPSGEYVLVEESDLERVSPQATHTIDIEDFVERAQIPATCFHRPYVLVPDRGGAKAYATLRDAMVKKGYVAVARIVIRTRQHLCAVMPEGDALVLELLRFSRDLAALDRHLRDAEQAVRGVVVVEKEAALAEQLIESLASRWDASRYRDTYREALLAALEEKARSGAVPSPSGEGTRRAPVTDLVALLQKSVARSRRGATSTRDGATPSRGRDSPSRTGVSSSRKRSAKRPTRAA